MPLYKNLAKYREQAGIKSAKDFAKQLGIPYTSYRNYEDPNKQAWPKEEILKKMAQTLNVSIDTLLDYSADNAPGHKRAKRIAKMFGTVFYDDVANNKIRITKKTANSTVKTISLSYFDFSILVYAAYNMANKEIEKVLAEEFKRIFTILCAYWQYAQIKDLMEQGKLKDMWIFEDVAHIDFEEIPDGQTFADWVIEVANKPTRLINVGDVDKSELLKALKGDTGHEGGKA